MELEFGRSICGDLDAAERREWLVTNGLGGFASGTIAGTLTRRYHGLLIAALHPPVQRTLLVAKIDETARYRNGTYELGANRWRNAYVAPQGYTSIERFRLDGTAPVWEYAIADALLEKRIWMEWGANETYVRYHLLRGSAPLDLSLRAFVNYRGFHANTHADGWQIAVTKSGQRSLRVDAFENARTFWVAADDGDLTIENVWYRDFILSEETQRGLDDRDDHLAAGSLAVRLKAGESVALRCADTESAADLQADAALARRGDRDRWLQTTGRSVTSGDPPWVERCVLAADQFVVSRPTASDPSALSVIAGYHWFSDWGRDTMISLPGLALATGRPEVAAKILATYAAFVDGGMLPNVFPDAGQSPQYNTIDAALWYVEAAARYAESTSDLDLLAKIWPALQNVITHYRDGTRYNIHMDGDGLIAGGAPGVQLTWMDAKVGDWVVTPRAGKPVEVAALWYNALARMRDLATRLGSSDRDSYAALAKRAAAGFQRFWNADAGCLYDVLDGPGGNDPSLRPNQVFAVSLPHSPLDEARARAVVDVCSARLVTSRGLRSLDPADSRFVAQYAGPPQRRDGAYHQGTVWTWLLGPFVVAHARVYRDAALARSFLAPLADALGDFGLGTLGEIADGEAPFEPRGAIAQAWSVAELLRAWRDVPAAAASGLPATQP